MVINDIFPILTDIIPHKSAFCKYQSSKVKLKFLGCYELVLILSSQIQVQSVIYY